ncbi:uncharacterized protein LOC143345171 [Colletes latitarsis]|uniref:uncharacterized protein LOC143345171 n=1 Tax=Colletes latitarsis TaxID=2605962 RepID=UPI0040367511
MSDMRMWSHKFITEFIELYKSFPCLYNFKSEGYTHKQLRNTCYNKMVEKLKEIDPTATKDSVVKKIGNMRSSYRKELKKVKRYKRNGSVYEPSLWYFHLLDFLYDHEVSRSRNANTSQEDNNEDEEEVNDEDDTYESYSKLQSPEEQTTDLDPLALPNLSETPLPHLSASSVSKRILGKRKIEESQSKQDIEFDFVDDKLQQTQNKYTNYGAYISDELNDLSPTMAIYCQKLINDAIFEAKCGNLSRRSRIWTPPETTNVPLT